MSVFFNNRMKEFRERKNLKLEWMSRRMGLSKGYLSQLESNSRRVYMGDYCKALDILGYELVVKEKKNHKDTFKVEPICNVDADSIEGFEKVIKTIDVYNHLVERVYIPSDRDLLNGVYGSWDEGEYEEDVFWNRLIENKQLEYTFNEKKYPGVLCIKMHDDRDVNTDEVYVNVYKNIDGEYELKLVNSYGRTSYLGIVHNEYEIITACYNTKSAYIDGVISIDNIDKLDIWDESNRIVDLNSIRTKIYHNEGVNTFSPESMQVETGIFDDIMNLKRLIKRFNTVDCLVSDGEDFDEMYDFDLDLVKEVGYVYQGDMNNCEMEVVVGEGKLLNILFASDMDGITFCDISYIELGKSIKYVGRIDKSVEVFKFILAILMDNKKVEEISLLDLASQDKYFYCDDAYEDLVAKLIDESKKYDTKDGRSENLFLFNKGYLNELNILIDSFNKYSEGDLVFCDFSYNEYYYTSSSLVIKAKDIDNNNYIFEIDCKLDVDMRITEANGMVHIPEANIDITKLHDKILTSKNKNID